jgi:hypothetical protein
MVLQSKQEDFLKKIKEVGPFINLHPTDENLIDEVLFHRAYTNTQKPHLERLRQRWFGDRDNKIF